MGERVTAVTMPEQPSARVPRLRVRVTGRQLHRWIAAVVPYAATSNHIPALACVQLLVHPQPDGTAVLYLTATNRAALATVRIPIANTTSGTTSEVTDEVADGVAGGIPGDLTGGVAGEVQGWRVWDLTIPARALSGALTGITRRGRNPLELALDLDGFTIRPEGGFTRYVPATGHQYLRWDRLVHTYNPAAADPVDALEVTPAHLALLGRVLPHARHDAARLRLVRTPSGAGLLAVTITEHDHEIPWFTALCIAGHTPEPATGWPAWPDLDQLSAELDHQQRARDQHEHQHEYRHEETAA